MLNERTGRKAGVARAAAWTVSFTGVVLGVLAPLGIYGLIWGSAGGVAAWEALEALERQEGSAVLVDVRPEGDFDQRHIRGAVNWPSPEIDALTSLEGIPPLLNGRALYLICEAGLSSATAARRLTGLGVEAVYSVTGGMQAWVGACAQDEASAYCSWGSDVRGWERATIRRMSLPEQWAAVLSAFVVKPLYMLGALILIVVLGRSQSQDLRLLRWGMSSFLAGETCCAANYIFFQGGSLLLDYWHAAGMVVAFGLTGLAVMEGLDSRFLHLSDRTKPCASLRMCGRCIKNRDVPCAARRGFLLLSGLMATLAFVPILAPFRTTAYNTVILGTPYSYLHPVALQLFEIRYCPMVALVLLAGAFGLLLIVKKRPTSAGARALFAAGAGALVFGALRLALLSIFEGDQVWASFWEELTELEFVLGVGAVLWIFRASLLATAPQALEGG